MSRKFGEAFPFFYAWEEKAMLLLRKATSNFIQLLPFFCSKNITFIQSNVPGRLSCFFFFFGPAVISLHTASYVVVFHTFHWSLMRLHGNSFCISLASLFQCSATMSKLRSLSLEGMGGLLLFCMHLSIFAHT